MRKRSDLNALRRLWPLMRRDSWAFVLALILTPMAAALNLAQPYLVKRIIDEHVTPGLTEGLSTLALVYLATLVGAYIVEGIYVLAMAWAGQRTIIRLRAEVYQRLLSLPRSFLESQPAGRFMTRSTSDVDALGEAFSMGLIAIILDLLMIGGTLMAMFWLDFRMTLVLLLFSPILLALLNFMRKKLRRLYLEIREALAAVNAFLSERVDGVETLQLFNAEEEAAGRFEGLNRHFRNATTTSNIYDAVIYAAVDGASAISVALMLWYGAGFLAPLGLAPKEAISAGLLLAFLQYLNRLFKPLRELSAKIAMIQRGSAALEKIFDLLDHEGVDLERGEALSGIEGNIVMKDVFFRYRKEGPDILKGINLQIRPKETVALVGSTGSGKTTLTRLLDGSYSGYRGSIKVDGHELRELALRGLRSGISGVHQDPQLFSESLDFNLRLDHPEISEDRRDQAAALVHADGIAATLGWESVLRERGHDVSVGEAQLLSLCRAMAHFGELIILDEATASIDSMTEKLIQDALEKIFSRRTVIVIAHRLSTVRKADRIAVMEGGMIVEFGDHQSLAEAGGVYAAMLRSGEELLT